MSEALMDVIVVVIIFTMLVLALFGISLVMEGGGQKIELDCNDDGEFETSYTTLNASESEFVKQCANSLEDGEIDDITTNISYRIPNLYPPEDSGGKDE